MSDVARITVDGVPRDVPAGGTLLDALRGLGFDVPTLCHDERLRPHSVCRMCVVSVDGHPHPVPSCSTPVLDGMVVHTTSPSVEEDRRNVLVLLAHRLPAEALCAPEEHAFARYLRRGALQAALEGESDATRIDDSHPYIHVDMSRCIDCFRCVRICGEVQGQFVWSVWNRGDRTEIHPDSGTSLLESSCVGCGACVTACPTGALEDKTLLERGAPTGRTRTTCPYCGVGCELDVRTKGGRIVQVLPILDAPVNKGHLCVKGRYAFEFVESSERLTTPLVRDGDGWRPVSWTQAVAFIAERLRDIIARRGPDSVGMLGSARATNEENYVAQKFARVVLGTNNVDSCARVCHAPSARALSAMLGTGAATSSFDDIELARTILLCGANATEGHPVVGARIKQQALRGANLIVIDPRRIELTRVPGALHLAVRPGGNVALLNSLASVLVEEGLVDGTFLRDRVDGWPPFRDFVRRFRPEQAATASGVAPELVREAARRYGRDTPSISFHGLGLTEHVQGTEGVMALVNLALLTGNIGKPGTGVNPLRGQNNVQGAAHMGCDPSGLTGLAHIGDAAPLFERVWGAPVPRGRGLRMPDMMDAAAEGRFKALWVMGYDVLLTNPDAERTRRSLEQLELLVVQDIFMNETARELAHVVLPSACSFEKEGTFMNAERRVQRVRKAVEPPGEARTDWEPLCEVARGLGKDHGFHFRTAEEIWEEIRQVWPGGRGISYARLERGGLQWPCPEETHPGTTLLHTETFASGARAALRAIEHVPTAEQTSPEFPLLLNTGRSLYQFNAGTMTTRTRNRVLRPTDRLDVSPADAARAGLGEGERVRVCSRQGATVLSLHIDEWATDGQLFATFSDPATRLNAVTASRRDPHTGTPEYKVTAVRIERA
ncbi:MAG TPA: formate dehydrogenase subunit alpha [Polyangiaceae bacterium]|jgi:formate dehydrogenase major subunit